MNFNNISSWSIKNPIPIVLMFIVIGLTFIQFKWVERRVHYH